MRRITILGEPFGKQRHRAGKGFSYTPAKTVNYENLVQLIYQEAYAGQKMLEGPMAIRIDAWFGIPKSTSKKKKALMLEGKIRPTKRPDIDNIEKIIADALEGLAYANDSCIVKAQVEKWYAEIPRVEVRLVELEVELEEV